jgi:hypothetical protein
MDAQAIRSVTALVASQVIGSHAARARPCRAASSRLENTLTVQMLTMMATMIGAARLTFGAPPLIPPGPPMVTAGGRASPAIGRISLGSGEWGAARLMSNEL